MSLTPWPHDSYSWTRWGSTPLKTVPCRISREWQFLGGPAPACLSTAMEEVAITSQQEEENMMIGGMIGGRKNSKHEAFSVTSSRPILVDNKWYSTVCILSVQWAKIFHFMLHSQPAAVILEPVLLLSTKGRTTLYLLLLSNLVTNSISPCNTTTAPRHLETKQRDWGRKQTP